MNINITGSCELKKISFLFLVLVIFSISACDTLEDTFDEEIVDPDGLRGHRYRCHLQFSRECHRHTPDHIGDWNHRPDGELQLG